MYNMIKYNVTTDSYIGIFQKNYIKFRFYYNLLLYKLYNIIIVSQRYLFVYLIFEKLTELVES